ncbi:MATE family efflux transporter, partial [Clostridium botulinum]|nr:MATE family efflux transporter [Clostridium botulinum]NFH73573.1 MATE family efflux transporter [Clostridium botulinum]NFH74342.1 MATE family efflux transporter [Clostridium botulinum]NFI01904.1 MATE family efflux transporter [Clostridium botulinum]NFI02639.1 MATE family efflux transporter [Clostridium botulinum]
MKKVDLTEGKVAKVILTLAIPIMGSSLLQFAYNLIDMIWVGGLGSNAVASIGSSSFFIGLGYSINALVVIGAGIKVSHAIGEKDEKSIKG